MVLFSRRFGEDTPETRAGAARAMRIVYLLIALLGAVFLAFGLTAETIQVRTIVQALIFMGLGLGGIAVTWRGMQRA
jgi:hypothetical protein